jgi:hypothetical protein
VLGDYHSMAVSSFNGTRGVCGTWCILFEGPEGGRADNLEWDLLDRLRALHVNRPRLPDLVERMELGVSGLG